MLWHKLPVLCWLNGRGFVKRAVLARGTSPGAPGDGEA
jgi:hypothetical protein